MISASQKRVAIIIKWTVILFAISMPVAEAIQKAKVFKQQRVARTSSNSNPPTLHDYSCTIPEVGRPYIANSLHGDRILSSATAKFAKCRVAEAQNEVNLLESGKRIRCYVNLSNSIAELSAVRGGNDAASADLLAKLRNLLAASERALFPFVGGKHTRVQDWAESYVGRGIVIASSSRFMRYAVFLLKNLRMLGCKLPVEVFYAGARDLSVEHRRQLEAMGAKVQDLLDLIDDAQVRAEGFAVKPFAMFASSFREAVLLDADTVFLRNPEELFDEHGYRDSGALFFADQSGGNGYHRAWFEDNLPAPHSERLRNYPIYSNRVFDHMESSVIVMDKSRSLLGLLAVCRLNMKKEREQQLYVQFFGDKETWWIGFEVAQADYAFSPRPPGAIGALSDRNATTFCGKLAHRGPDDRPFWWNQGIVQDKFEHDERIPRYEVFTRNGIWIACMSGTDPIALNRKELNIIDSLKRLWNETVGFDVW